MEELTQKQREEQEKLLREGSGWDCYYFALLRGADVQALSRRCAEVGEGLDCYAFAIDIKGADVQALQARVLKVGDGWDCYKFALEIEGADVQALQARVLKVGSGLDCYKFAKSGQGADIQALQARLLEVGAGPECERFALDIKEADIQALSRRVAEVGTLADCYDFALLQGADIQTLEARIEELETLVKYKYEIIKKSVARHVHSDALLINGRWLMDYDNEAIITGGQDNFEDYVDIIDKDDEGYNPEDPEQEIAEDYEICEYTFEIAYTEEQEEQYREYGSDHDRGRDSYYGWCMHGGGGKKEFNNMYGNGDCSSFAEWLCENGMGDIKMIG